MVTLIEGDAEVLLHVQKTSHSELLPGERVTGRTFGLRLHPPPRKNTTPPPRTAKQQATALKDRVEKLVMGRAVGKAMRAVLPSGSLATPAVAVKALPNYCPQHAPFTPPPLAPTPVDALD